MARSVGEIEVTVDADTGRLVAQLKAAGKTGGKAAAEAIDKELRNLSAEIRRVDLPHTQAQKAAKVLAKQIEAQLKGIEVGIDLTQAREDLREFQKRESQRELELSVALGKTSQREFDARMRKIQEKWESNDVQLGIDLQTGLAIAEAEALEREIEQIETQLKIEADTTQATLDLFRFKERTEADDVELQVEMHIIEASVLAAKAEIDRLMGGVEVEVEPDVKTSEWAKARFAIQQWANDAGDGAGKSFGDGFISGDNTKLIAAAILALGDPLVAGLSGLIAAGTSVVSSGVVALGAAAGAAVPLMTSLGVSMGAVAVGSAGMGDALGLVNEEFAKAEAAGRPLNTALLASSAAFRELSPDARDTALAFAEIRDELATVQDQVSREVFAGMGDVLREIGAEVLPEVSQGLQIAGQSANEFGTELAAVAANTDFLAMAQALDPALDDAFDAGVALADTLEPFLRAAAPAAERLAEMIERGAEGLRDWFSNTGNQRKFADFLDSGLTSLRRWTELLKSTGDLLATIFDAGAESGDNFVISLNNMIERWDALLESDKGQNMLAEFFDTGKEAVEAFKPLLDGLKEAFDVLVTPDALSNLQGLGEALGRALPALAQLISLLGQLQLATAFANIVAAIGPVLDLLNSLPGSVLEVIGTVIVLTRVIGFLSTALKALKATNPEILALSLALTAVVIAFQAFGGGVSDAKKRTDELNASLRDTVDAIVTSGEVAAGAEVGFKALNQAIFETGDGGEKLQAAFATINRGAGEATLGIEDTTRVLAALRDGGDESEAMLKELARGWGLAAGPAAELAEIVNDTDDNFQNATVTGTILGNQMNVLAEKTGIPVETLVELAKALEESQDQAENTNFDELAQSFIDAASTGSAQEQQMLAQAEAAAAAAGKAGDAQAVYQELTKIMNAQANASDDSASAALNQASSYELVNEAIQDALAAQEERRQALIKEGQAAFEAHKKEELLAQTTKDAAEELAVSQGFSEDFAEGLINIGEAADEAAESASALTESFDILFGRSATAQEAFDSFYQTISDLNEQLAESGESALPKVGSELEAVFGTTDAALGFRDAMRSGVDEMLAYAEAATNAGTPSADINAKLAAMRDTLVNTGSQFGLTTEQVDTFISSLMGTPELVSTIISTPGMIDALLNAKDLTLLYDAAGNPVITEFEAQGIDPAMASVEGFQDLVVGLSGVRGEPTIAAPTIPEVEGDVEGLQTGVDTLDASKASPTVAIPSADAVERNIDTLQRKFDALDRTDARPTVAIQGAAVATTAVNNVKTAIDKLVGKTVRVDVTGAVQAKQEVDNLRESIRLLQDKTVTIRTNTIGPGAMAGRIVTGPSLVPVGERGYAEAIVPLQLPLSRVDPSVRELAAMLRGEGRRPVTTTGVQRIINNTLNITPQSADPAAVATQVINRAAAMSR